MKCVRAAVGVLVGLGFVLLWAPQDATAHRSGCHAQHSCPSDSGSYVCGDTGHTSECPRAQPSAAAQCFQVPEIPDCIDGAFGTFWKNNGLLPVFGYPITSARPETNQDTKQTYSTQWFERNRFEQHSENAAPYNILLGRLGAELLQSQGRDWHNETNTGNPFGGTCRHFDATNHDVCGPFLAYWLGHGLNDPKLDAYGKSLQLFGLPLTGVKSETNASGVTVLTQWFERARFEWYPNNADPYKVQLGLLGKERLNAPFVADPTKTFALNNLGTVEHDGVRLDVARVLVTDKDVLPSLDHSFDFTQHPGLVDTDVVGMIMFRITNTTNQEVFMDTAVCRITINGEIIDLDTRELFKGKPLEILQPGNTVVTGSYFAIKQSAVPQVNQMHVWVMPATFSTKDFDFDLTVSNHTFEQMQVDLK